MLLTIFNYISNYYWKHLDCTGDTEILIPYFVKSNITMWLSVTRISPWANATKYICTTRTLPCHSASGSLFLFSTIHFAWVILLRVSSILISYIINTKTIDMKQCISRATLHSWQKKNCVTKEILPFWILHPVVSHNDQSHQRLKSGAWTNELSS